MLDLIENIAKVIYPTPPFLTETTALIKFMQPCCNLTCPETVIASLLLLGGHESDVVSLLQLFKSLFGP